MTEFDPLDERYRWCVYCRADCWPEPENQRHDVACPSRTGVYPVMPMHRLPDGTFGCCSSCSSDFALGDLYVLSNETTGVVDGPAPDTGFVQCLGCGAVGAQVS